MQEPKSRDKSRVIKENQTDLLGFSVFELFDQLADYYNKRMRNYPRSPGDYQIYHPTDRGPNL